jgi:hypothetical protein
MKIPAGSRTGFGSRSRAAADPKKNISDPPHCNWVRQNCAKAECELQMFYLIE